MPVKTIRAVTLAILFLVALALAFLSFALLLLAVVLCIFFALLAFLAAPEETKAFVRGSRDTVDAWVRAMVKLVEDAGRMMEAWMARFAGGTAQASEANAGEEEAAKKPEAASEDASDRPAPTKENALTETAKTTESVAKTPEGWRKTLRTNPLSHTMKKPAIRTQVAGFAIWAKRRSLLGLRRALQATREESDRRPPRGSGP